MVLPMFHKKPFPSPLFRTEDGDLGAEEKVRAWEQHTRIITGAEKAVSHSDPGRPHSPGPPLLPPALLCNYFRLLDPES